MRRCAALLVGLAMGIAAQSADAAGNTYSVTPGGADPATPGTCSGAAPSFSCPNLRTAAADATTGSTIRLGAGSYPLSASLELPSGVAIAGAGSTLTVIKNQDGTLSGAVISVDPGATNTLRGLELTSVPVMSSGALNGGLIYDAGALTLQDDLLTDGLFTAGFGDQALGGAVLLEGGSPTLTVAQSTISDNEAIGGPRVPFSGAGGGNAFGGAIEAANTSSVTIVDSTLAGNEAIGGAGGSGALEGPSITGPGGAGGLGVGGAIDDEGALTLVNDTIAGNTAGGGAGGASTTAQGAVGLAAGGALSNLRSAVLASTTIDGNSAVGTGAVGGNIYLNGGSMTIGDTIIAGGTVSAGGFDNDCSPGTVTDRGHNLEDDAGGQCGASGASDVPHGDPMLGRLASNGGPTQTIALLPGSPALGAGGACTDPASVPANEPLLIDQRLLPRPSGGPCDVGAFQFQPVSVSAAPKLSGTPSVGRTLTCTPGRFNGDGALVDVFSWRRDGTPIAGATMSKYKVSSADAGHKLTCAVTATGLRGSATGVSAGLSIPARAPLLSSVSQSSTRWTEGTRAATIARRRKPPVGTTFKFRLNEAATVRLVFKRRGRKAGTLAFAARAGTDKVRFDGVLSRHHKLKPGSYTLIIVATASHLSSKAHELRFSIVT